MKTYMTTIGRKIKVNTDRKKCKKVCKELGLNFVLYPGDKVTHSSYFKTGTVVGVAPATEGHGRPEPMVIWAKFPSNDGITYSYPCMYKKV